MNRIGDWEPCWLGPASRALYAAVHAGPDHANTGVVLVPPLLDELPRSRRFITEVAHELAAMGLPTLRFDFFGSGDSCGRGDELDFQSMRCDLDLATAALRARSGVARVVLIAWRGAALAVDAWLARGGGAELVVLWEPVCDGAAWLQSLVEADSEARAVRPRPRPGVELTGGPEDGQLMGYRASERLRADLGQARLHGGLAGRGTRVWTIVPASGGSVPTGSSRVLPLPASAPKFCGGASMDATLFLTPPVRGFVRELGLAVTGEALA